MTKNNKKLKFTSKDIKFEVGDIIYRVDKDNSTDYSMKQMILEQFKIKEVILNNNSILYRTTTECEIVDYLENYKTNQYFKTREAAIKAFSLESIIFFEEAK